MIIGVKGNGEFESEDGVQAGDLVRKEISVKAVSVE